MARTIRSWTEEDEERLDDLVSRVEDAVRAGRDGKAVRDVVPGVAGCDSIAELAREMGEDRSNLSACLGGIDRNTPMRRRLDRHLGLPPGGMERVLSLIEGG